VVFRKEAQTSEILVSCRGGTAHIGNAAAAAIRGARGGKNVCGPARPGSWAESESNPNSHGRAAERQPDIGTRGSNRHIHKAGGNTDAHGFSDPRCIDPDGHSYREPEPDTDGHRLSAG